MKTNNDFLEIDSFFERTLSDYELPDVSPDWESMNKRINYKKRMKRLLSATIVVAVVSIGSVVLFVALHEEKVVDQSNKEKTSLQMDKGPRLNLTKAETFQQVRRINANQGARRFNNNWEIIKGNVNVSGYHLSQRTNVTSSKLNKGTKFSATLRKNAKLFLSQKGALPQLQSSLKWTDIIDQTTKISAVSAEQSSFFTSGPFTHKFYVDKESVKIEIQKLPVNSEFSDFGPVISADGMKMFFTSRRITAKKKGKQNKPEFEKIFSWR